MDLIGISIALPEVLAISPAHAGQLTDLLHRASRTGIGEHVNRVALTEGGVQLFLDRLGGVVPDLNNAVVTDVIRNQAAVVLALDLRNLLIGLRDQLLLVLWDQRVAYRDGQAALGGIFKALVLMRSRISEVRTVPQLRMQRSMIWPSCFFLTRKVTSRSNCFS